MANKHTCHAVRCKTPVPAAKFMCRLHWGLVPADLKKELYAAYRPGQEKDKNPSKVYLYVAFRIEGYVAVKEGFWDQASADKRNAMWKGLAEEEIKERMMIP